MDQTTLPFVLDDNKTYDKKGAAEVWIASGQSGLEKHQCTIQLTVFADEKTLPPLIIFRGHGLRINGTGKNEWDRRVNVVFQPKAWCDENIMKSWVSEDWDNYFPNPATRGSTRKILFADIHRAQETGSVKQLLHKKKTILINIPGSATSRAQPLRWLLTNHLKIVFKNYSKNILIKTLKLK